MILSQNSLRRTIVVLAMQEHQSNIFMLPQVFPQTLNNSGGLSIPQVLRNEMRKVVLLDFVDVG